MLAVLWGVGSYVGEEPQRRQAAHNSAWQLSNSATGQKASGGRIEALQELNKDAISLAGLVASGANLQVIKLPKANLLEADLQGANLAYADLQGASLAFANLRDVDLGFANLEDANLRGAHLLGAKLQNANLQHAVLRGADLESANLKSAILDHADFTGSDVAYADFRDSKNLTASQVRLARNWELALFDAQLKEELGLNP